MIALCLASKVASRHLVCCISSIRQRIVKFPFFDILALSVLDPFVGWDVMGIKICRCAIHKMAQQQAQRGAMGGGRYILLKLLTDFWPKFLTLHFR